MAKAIVSTVLLLFSAVAAFSQSVRDQATELLSRAEKTSLQLPADGTSPYHERVKFAFPESPDDIKGQIVKDYLSGHQWRERVELGNYQRITVRNGGQSGEFRSASFDPLWLDTLRRSLPPVVIRFEHNDKVHKVITRIINGVANKCIEYESRPEGSHEENELCASEVDGTLTSLQQRIVEGACLFGCRTETKWSDYSPFGGHFYPRHVRITKYSSIVADVEFAAASDLNPDTFRIPGNLEIRKACDKTSPPMRLRGDLPSYPHRMNEWLFEGSVAVQARIGVDGRVQEAQIANPRQGPRGFPGLTPSLDGQDVYSVILEAVRKWVFEPAKCDGLPMVDNTLITFRVDVR
jgi:hypothetical protein